MSTVNDYRDKIGSLESQLAREHEEIKKIGYTGTLKDYHDIHPNLQNWKDSLAMSEERLETVEAVIGLEKRAMDLRALQGRHWRELRSCEAAEAATDNAMSMAFSIWFFKNRLAAAEEEMQGVMKEAADLRVHAGLPSYLALEDPLALSVSSTSTLI